MKKTKIETMKEDVIIELKKKNDINHDVEWRGEFFLQCYEDDRIALDGYGKYNDCPISKTQKRRLKNYLETDRIIEKIRQLRVEANFLEKLMISGFVSARYDYYQNGGFTANIREDGKIVATIDGAGCPRTIRREFNSIPEFVTYMEKKLQYICCIGSEEDQLVYAVLEN